MHRMLGVSVVILMVLAGACGGDGDDPPVANDGSSGSAAGDGPAVTSPGGSADFGQSEPLGEFPCNLLGTAEVEAVTGADLADGESTVSINTRNDAEWESVECAWIGDDQEVTLDVAVADGFSSGSVECIEGGTDAVEVDGPGDQVLWTWDGPLVVALLQVCTPDALVLLTLDSWDDADEAGAQAVLVTLAGTAVAGL